MADVRVRIAKKGLVSHDKESILKSIKNPLEAHVAQEAKGFPAVVSLEGKREPVLGVYVIANQGMFSDHDLEKVVAEFFETCREPGIEGVKHSIVISFRTAESDTETVRKSTGED